MNMKQTLKLDVSNSKFHRFTFFDRVCAGKSVLHIGHVGARVNKKLNMHLRLDKLCSNLVGCDPAYKMFEPDLHLLKHKKMYGKITDIEEDEFDLVIVPEVMEHVDNVALFLEELQTIEAKEFYISVPNAFASRQRNNGSYNSVTGMWTETVHPDHNCWYSPYTLQNTIQKYSSFKVKSIGRLYWSSIYAVLEKP